MVLTSRLSVLYSRQRLLLYTTIFYLLFLYNQSITRLYVQLVQYNLKSYTIYLAHALQSNIPMNVLQ